MKYLLTLMTGMLMVALLLVSAQASADDVGEAGEPEFSQMVTHFLGELETSKLTIEDEEWIPADIEKYLYNAMAVVYYARLDVCRYSSENVPLLNDDLSLLVDLGYLPYWPGDPLNCWEPMNVVSPDEGFLPNSLCLALCPPEHSSPLSDGGSGQVSFDLFVYGSDINSVGVPSVIQVEENKAWSEIPQGALYGLGFHMSSFAEIAENKRLIEIYEAKQAEMEE